MDEKKQDFVVSDRRRFGTEGERRPDAPASKEEAEQAAASAATTAPAATAAPPAEAAPPQPAAPDEHEAPEPPTAEEQHQQNEAYKASGKKLDEIFTTKLGAQGNYPEITFEKVIESFYMSALIQMGALRQEGETPQMDIIGARQTIDSLTIMQEKTKGNLTEREQTMLQNVLFELRMAWIEITNAIAAQAAKPPAPPAAPQE